MKFRLMNHAEGGEVFFATSEGDMERQIDEVFGPPDERSIDTHCEQEGDVPGVVELVAASSDLLDACEHWENQDDPVLVAVRKALVCAQYIVT